MDKSEAAKLLAFHSLLPSNNRRNKPRHTLRPMCMRDIADASGLALSTLYAKLKAMGISTKSVKSMSLKDLVNLINTLTPFTNDNK